MPYADEWCGSDLPSGPRERQGSGPLTAQSGEVSTLLNRVFTSFADSGVAWALLRGRSELATGRDVDLLVAAAHLPIAEEVIFGLGGAPLPQRRYPWHHMYIIDIPGRGPNLKLDIVTQVIYSRELLIASELERGCLERRIIDDGLYCLSATDTFWTILLHCVLDKRHVKQDRADELVSRVGDLERPSPGEDFFASLCPADWSPERAVDCVVRHDWQPLGDLGSQILAPRLAAISSPPASDAPHPTSASRKPRRLVDRVARRASDAATGAMFRKAWRGLGLGVVPHVFDIVEESRVDATVVELRRRPRRCDVVLVVENDQLPALLPVLLRDYRHVGGVWRRFASGALESVEIVAASELSLGAGPSSDPREPFLLLPGRTHCRMALSSGPGWRATSA